MLLAPRGDRMVRQAPRTCRRAAVTLAVLAVAALLLAAPVRANRSLHDSSVCPELVAGGSEAAAEVPAGSSAVVAAFQNVGPVYIVAAAEDAASEEGPSSFEIELWNDGTGAQEAAATSSAAGCATTPVVDLCQEGGSPAAVTVRLMCLNQDRACHVRVAAYMSACPDAPQPQAIAVPDSLQEGTMASPPPPAELTQEGTQPPLPPTATPPASSSGGSSSSSDSGISTTTWVIICASAAAALFIAIGLWCLCRRCKGRPSRPVADPETGGYFAPSKPHYAPPVKQQQQQQQFMVGGGSGGVPAPHWPPQPPHPPPHAGAAGPPAAGVAGSWAFAYKVAGSTRRTFATDAGRHEGVLQEWASIDEWLHRAVMAGQQWDGCLLFNDDPPPGCPRPEPYQPCAHAKGVLLWNAHRVGFLCHSIPKWPAPPGMPLVALPEIEDPQTVKGQSFLWLVLPAAQRPALLQQLLHMQVLVYHVSDARVWPYAPMDYTKADGRGMRVVQLSPGIWHVGKANQPHLAFYEDLARRFGGTWLVRTNLATNQSEDGKCPSTPAVANVSKWAPPGCDHAPYLPGSEHAKLAVCTSLPFALVGDLNNTKPQFKRGGGGVVLHHPHLVALMRAAAVEVGRP